jgi:hypothetical protein
VGSQFDDRDPWDHPSRIQKPVTRSNSQFHDTDYIDRPDGSSNRRETPQSSKSKSDDGDSWDYPGNIGKPYGR